MNEFEKKLNLLKKKLNDLKELLKIEEKALKLKELENKMSQPNFWQNSQEVSKVVEEIKDLKSDVEEWHILEKKIKDISELLEISDSSYENEILDELIRIEEDLEKLNLRALFWDKFDNLNAIVEINAGAGGTESCDWVAMLFRMYFRWAEEKKFKVSVLDELSGDEAGIKNITFLVEGIRAYGLLKSERGVHRLVRISPFDANKRRHTSFASVDVIPEIKEDIDVEINPQDLKIETFRASGKGGQHVNRTDSAVRITHIPTGIVVSCQNERSQYQNKQVALRVLRAKIYELKERERKKEIEKISGNKQKIEWGSQIRSYVLYPYLLVKDHRTNKETTDAWGVLDGNIDDFIYAYLKKIKC